MTRQRDSANTKKAAPYTVKPVSQNCGSHYGNYTESVVDRLVGKPLSIMAHDMHSVCAAFPSVSQTKHRR
jgi:hypothetical protein